MNALNYAQSTFTNQGLVTITQTSASGTSMLTGATGTTWTAYAYSNQGFKYGAFCSARADQTNTLHMIGLANSQVNGNMGSTFQGISYAWYFDLGTLRIYESGSLVANYGAYTTSTVVSITFDGTNIIYWKDGVSQRTVARAVGVPLYFGYAGLAPGSSVNSIQFDAFGSTTYAGRNIVGTTGSFSGNVGIGTSSPETKLLVKDGEITSNSASTSGQFRAVSGNYGFFIRNDGTDSYLMHTASGNPYGSYNANRPFRINNASALVTMGNGLSVSGGSGYTLDVSGDINCTGSYRISGTLQPKLGVTAYQTGMSSATLGTWDITNFNSVEIRINWSRNGTTGGTMTFSFKDSANNARAVQEAYTNTVTPTGGATSSSATATLAYNSEVLANTYGALIRLWSVNTGGTGGRYHYEFVSVGCYGFIGATRNYGGGFVTVASGTINQLVLTTSAGTFDYKSSVTQYV